MGGSQRREPAFLNSGVEKDPYLVNSLNNTGIVGRNQEFNKSASDIPRSHFGVPSEHEFKGDGLNTINERDILDRAPPEGSIKI